MITSKENIDLAKPALRQRKSDHEAELIQAKIDLCNATKAKATAAPQISQDSITRSAHPAA